MMLTESGSEVCHVGHPRDGSMFLSQSRAYHTTIFLVFRTFSETGFTVGFLINQDSNLCPTLLQ